MENAWMIIRVGTEGKLRLFERKAGIIRMLRKNLFSESIAKNKPQQVILSDVKPETGVYAKFKATYIKLKEDRYVDYT